MKKLRGENDIEATLQRLDRLTLDEARATASQTEEALRRLVRLTEDRRTADLTEEAVRLNQTIAQETLYAVNKAERGLFPIGNALIDDRGTEFDLQVRGR